MHMMTQNNFKKELGGGEVLAAVAFLTVIVFVIEAHATYSLRDVILPIWACRSMPDVMNSSERRLE